MKRSFGAILSALLALSLGVSLEWVLLTGSTPQAVYSASIPPTPTPVLGAIPANFQTGVVFPQWGTAAYSQSNKNFAFGLNEIEDQTGARWVEIPITLYQATFSQTHLDPSEQTATPQSLAEGVRAAHAHGFKVFVAPLLTVGATGWAGDIRFSRVRDTRAWFESYWQALQPYLQVASQEHVEQFALGTEYEALEAAPDDVWNLLISRARGVYSVGALTYDMNWTAALKTPRSWMVKNTDLTYLGVSEYRPLTTRPAPRDADGLSALWRYKIGTMLDTLHDATGKKIVLSEIGYRNSADALYQPWQWQSRAPADPELQAAAYEAAITNIINDPNIVGAYFWGWSVPAFGPNWLPAAQVLHRWYTLPIDRIDTQNTAKPPEQAKLP